MHIWEECLQFEWTKHYMTPSPPLVTLDQYSWTPSGGNSLFPVGGGGAKPPKFPTKLSNFRQPPPHLHLKRMFLALLLAQFSVKVGGGRPPHPPRHTEISTTLNTLAIKRTPLGPHRCVLLSPINTTLNFWYGTDKNGICTKFICAWSVNR